MSSPHVLSSHQESLLENLVWLGKRNFYLAGGTALALQLGHRTSVDFDFYSQDEFDSLELLAELQSRVGKLTVQSQEEKTLRVFSHDTELSFFVYSYRLLNPLVDERGILLASKEDIAAMKLIAVVQRGTQRDFVDIYFLLLEYSLQDLLTFAADKYPGYQDMVILKALVYFDDAEAAQPRQGVRVLTPEYSWEKAKAHIIAAVKTYQLGMKKP